MRADYTGLSKKIQEVIEIIFIEHLICARRSYNLPPKEQASLNFMAAVTICSDFGAQKNKISQCFHCFPIYLS